MTPRQLLERTPESICPVSSEMLIGFYFSHVPEVKELCPCGFIEGLEKSDKLKAKIYKDFSFDGRRYWRLAAIYFDDVPVMIIQNAGREGDDHHRRFVLNIIIYAEMIAHIISFIPKVIDPVKDVVEFDQDLGDDLTTFYGNKLDGHFERSRY